MLVQVLLVEALGYSVWGSWHSGGEQCYGSSESDVFVYMKGKEGKKDSYWFEITDTSLETSFLFYPVAPDLILFSSILPPFSIFVFVVFNLRHFH